jgi:hypothetical protein
VIGFGFLKLESFRTLKYVDTAHTKQKSANAEYKNVLVVPNIDWSFPPMIAPVLCPNPPYMAFININYGEIKKKKIQKKIVN